VRIELTTFSLRARPRALRAGTSALFRVHAVRSNHSIARRGCAGGARHSVLSSRVCGSFLDIGGLRGVPVPPASGGAGHVSDIGSAGSATGPARRARGAVVLLVGGTCCAVGGFGVRVPVKPLGAGGTGAPRAFPCPSGVRLVPAGGSLPQPLRYSIHVPT
jgi:hypothetical protein